MEFEQALERTERDAQATAKSAEAVTRAARRLVAAARIGDVSGIERSIAEADRSLQALRASCTNTREGWTFDLAEHVRDGGYAAELERAAAAGGLTLHEQEGRIFSYPLLLRVIPAAAPADVALTIDRKRDRRMRPSVLVDFLKKARGQQPKFQSAAFLKSLYAAYTWAEKEYGKPEPGSTRGPMIELVKLYELLTLAPRGSAEYSRQEFTRDLYLLDRSGLTTTATGARMELSASTGTKGSRSKLLPIVDPTGRELVYYAVCFWRDAQ